MVAEKFTSDVTEEEEEGDGGKSEPPATFLSALEGINTVRKYLLMVSVVYIKMAAISNMRTECTGVQQKAKKQQVTLMDVWKK
jgi:hypothetical protein